MSKNKKIKILFFFLLLFLLLPFTFTSVKVKDLGVSPDRNTVSSGAGFVYALEINYYPRLPGATAPQDFIDNPSVPSEDILSLYIKYIFNLALWLGGIIALGSLIYGGIRYLISTGKPEAMASAKNQITAVFFGILLLLSSYLIFTALNPELVVFQILGLKPIEIPERPIVSLSSAEKIKTSIDVEMPFGRIIEKIFETYISDYPAPQQTKTPRIERITDDVRAIIAEEKNRSKNPGIADKLKQQSEDLKSYSDQCTCHQTKPVTPCGGNKSGDTTWKCDCGGCSATKPVSSDPCKDVRNDIQKTEDKNKEEINNLTVKNIEIEKEVRLLKEELDRLKRAEKFIEECPLRSLNSLAQLYSKKNTFNKQGWTLRETNFWDDVSIVYYTSKPTIVNDFATFYCTAGGTLEEAPSFSSFTPSQQNLNQNMSVEEAEDVMSEAMACSDEAPVGEIIDRSKRVAQLLIDKLGQLVGKNKELIDAVDNLQVLISQCSSKRGCERRCTCFGCLCEHHDDCIPGCKGWAYGCADSSGNYPSGCKDRDEDTPCPYKEIDDQLKKIQKIWEEIKDIIEGKNENDTPADIGILPIINDIAPEILKDLEESVRIPMKECSSSDWLEQDKSLFNCRQVKEAIVPPENQTVKDCCLIEAWDQGKKIQTEYGDCYEECYLKKGLDEYRECVQQCLDKKAQQLGDEDIAHCTNQLNFYCCQAGG